MGRWVVSEPGEWALRWWKGQSSRPLATLVGPPWVHGVSWWAWHQAAGRTQPSVVLDLGRRTRLHTEPQRTALTIRDRGCTTQGCDRPAAWCHAHHDTPWAQGGPTSVANGRLLCPFHHRKAHSPGYDTTHLPTGQIQFHRRT